VDILECPANKVHCTFYYTGLAISKAFFVKDGFNMTTNEIIGMILSLLGMTVTIISFQVKNKVPLLIMQTIASILFMISYVFSGGGIAVVLNILMLVRNFLFMFLSKKRGRVIIIIVIALCISYILTYAIYTAVAKETLENNLWNLFPIFAAFFGTVSFANSNVNRLRIWKYGDSVSWIIYNIHIGWGALGGIIGELLNLVSLTIGIIRYRERRQKDK